MLKSFGCKEFVKCGRSPALAMRTCNHPILDHAIFGLASEAGEVAGIMQKTFQGHEFDKEHMAKELGDCLWMIAEACSALDLKLKKA